MGWDEAWGGEEAVLALTAVGRRELPGWGMGRAVSPDGCSQLSAGTRLSV